ncbi:MAG: TatD family hydrolase [Patescibacteria group bacterium]
MKPYLIDTHSHLQFKDYDADRDQVILRMRQKKVWTISVGTTIPNCEDAVRLAEKEDGVWAAIGYHPVHVSSKQTYEGEGSNKTYSLKKMRELCESKKVVAIGETGLDYHRLDENDDLDKIKSRQKEIFLDHLGLARDFDLPVIIHCRDAMNDLLKIIEKEIKNGFNMRGVMHCYAGPWEEAERILNLGLLISFTGPVTFKPKKNSDPETHVHRVIERTPLEKLMIETDAPFLAPEPYRGKRNEPVYVEETAKKIAELKKIDIPEVARKTTETAIKFFGLR